jgi:hydrogenase maturation protease
MKTIIVGLGNPILGDDGVGWRVAEELLNRVVPDGEIQIECASLGGLSLMERLEGYERAILIDCIKTRNGGDGCVRIFPLDALPEADSGHSSSAHDTSLQTAVETGRHMGLELPKTITVVAVEATIVHDFSETLTPIVAIAVPVAIQAVLDLIQLP